MSLFLTKIEGGNVFFPPGFESLRFERLQDAKDYVNKQPRDGSCPVGVGYGGNISGWRIIVGKVNQ